MAEVADRVVVELIANNAGFNDNVRSSASAYQQSMGAIENAADGAEKAHGRMSLATNNSRIAMLELQHVARGTSDQIAAGAPLTQILTEHLGELSEAAALSGSSLGAVGELLSGPWGIALTLATILVGKLILSHKEEATTVDTLVEKLQKHHDQTELSAQADQAWANTLDGLIDREKKLNEELANRLRLQPIADRQAYANAVADLATQGAALSKAENDPATPAVRLEKMEKAFAGATRALFLLSQVEGQAEGQALADANAFVKRWEDFQTNKIEYLTGVHPELLQFSAQINAAFAQLKKGVEDASKAGVDVSSVTNQVGALNDKLAQQPGTINEYIAALKRLGQQFESLAGQDGAVKKFEAALDHAEGSGKNRMGSSAAGFGQFMPATWLKYFNETFPSEKSTVSDEYKLSLRGDKDTATAVIKTATEDYKQVLENAGQQITAASLYTMHLLSAGTSGKTALRLLNAPGNEPTSDFLSAGVLRGNPFLIGTAQDARNAIAKRIGDGAGGASVLAAQQSQLGLQTQLQQKLEDILGKEMEVSIVKKDQLETGHDLLTIHAGIEKAIEASLPGLKAWAIEYDQIKASGRELLDVGDQLVEDVFNPNNWTSWGSAGKAILHDLEAEFLKLAAINPLKNLLAGPNAQKLPTLGSIASLFGSGGGGGMSAANAGFISDTLGLMGFAEGGAVSAGKAIIVGERGPEVFVPGSSGTIVPNNGTAASPWGGGGTTQVVIGVEASEYFDARVVRTAGPVIAQASVAAANGGASLSRRNLAREAQHRLD